VSAPGKIGNVLPHSGNNTGQQPTLPTRSNALQSLSTSQQTTAKCPNGLAPDSNYNCPTAPTTTNQQVAPLQSLGGSVSNPTPEHHHKGNNQQAQIGGQESTVPKKVKYQK
jgi:hypothetical protein